MLQRLLGPHCVAMWLEGLRKLRFLEFERGARVEEPLVYSN